MDEREAANRMEALTAEARYRRERAELYRARMSTGRATNLQKMRELDRAADQAAERLAAAKRTAAAAHDDA
jgi:hypothetical protein